MSPRVMKAAAAAKAMTKVSFANALATSSELKKSVVTKVKKWGYSYCLVDLARHGKD